MGAELIDTIIKTIGDFNIKARVTPAVIVISPVILFVAYNMKLDIKNNIILLCFIIVLMLPVVSMMCRTLGKEAEEKMTQRLGGFMPSAIIMSYLDSHIDIKTKDRYHSIINEKYHLNLPVSLEAEEKTYAMEKYTEASNILRKMANANRDKVQGVYEELVKYNTYRNVYGCKYISIALCACVEVLEIANNYNNITISSSMLLTKPFTFTVLTIVLLMIYMLYFNKKNLERYAFDYAKALFESIEILKNL